MREVLESVERTGGVRVTRQLNKLQKAADEFIAKLETDKKLDEFPH